MADLLAIVELPQKDRIPAYLSLLPALYVSPLPNLVDLIEHLVTEPQVGLVAGRQVFSEIVDALSKGAIQDKEVWKTVCENSIKVVADASRGSGTAGSFEEQVTALRLQLAELLEGEEEWGDAAKVLMAVDLSNRNIPDAEKLKHVVHIVRLLLEVGDDGQAQMYYSRASALIHTTDDKQTLLQYKLAQARLFDFSRKFNEAAQSYYNLSNNLDIDEDDRLSALGAATTCSILAPAGPQRLRILASIYRDERSSYGLPEFKYTILSKMYLENILRSSEVEEFEKSLLEHQLAKLPPTSGDKLATSDEDGDEVVEDVGVSQRLAPETVLDKAVMEHNLLSCSKLYNNITFFGLGALLDLAPGAAENMARRMIEQGRLRAWIDQIDKLIYFEGRDVATESATVAGGLSFEKKNDLDFNAITLTEKWDSQIGRTANKVEGIVNLLKSKGLLTPISSTAGVAIDVVPMTE